MNVIGHGTVVLKSDQAFAITELQRTTEDARTKAFEEIMTHLKSIGGMNDEVEVEPTDVVTDNSRVGESKANGAVEKAIKRIQGQARTVRTATEEALGIKLAPTPDDWQWLV